MFKLFTSSKTKEQKQKQTVQQAIPLKSVHGNLLITPTNKLVKLLKITSRNMELMSNFEMNSVFEQYQDFLTGLEFPIQQTIVSQPVDLSGYIELQKKILKDTTNEVKKQLLENYIEHGESYTKSNQIIQRQRYLVFSVQIQDGTEESYMDANKDLEEKMLYIKSGLRELELSAEDLTNTEIIKYFHTFFDYRSAQLFPIENEGIPQIITGEKINVG